MKQIKAKPFNRSLEVREVDEEGRTVSLAFSSEEPVERFFGIEILDHSPESVRLDRMKEGGPVLVGHNPDDHVGVVEDIEIGPDRVGRAKVRFGRSVRAQEIFQDIQDGIRKGVSVGYRIHELEQVESRDSDGAEVYRATDWSPHEISIVSIPADTSVGVGRSLDEADDNIISVRTLNHSGDITMSEKENTAPAGAEKVLTDADVRAAASQAEERSMKKERERVDAIMAVADKTDTADLARSFINEGKPAEEFFRAVLESDKFNSVPATPSEVGLNEKEARQFSFVRAIRAQLPNASRRDIEAAAFEREASEAAAKAYGKEPQGILVPDEVLNQKRDLTVGTNTAGGHTVATELLAESFIEFLRNQVVVEQAGATVLTGLQGDIAIPKQDGTTTAYWVDENSAVTESNSSFAQVSLSPKTVGTFQDYSRKLLLQSSIGIENFVRNDLASMLAVEIDRVAIEGDPDTTATQYEPRGILQQSGIGSVALGTNGAAPTFEDTVALIREVAEDNALRGNLCYLTNSQAWYKLATTKVDSGSGRFIIDPSMMTTLNGYPLKISENVPADGTKGSGSSLSALIFGNFQDFLFGYWSGVDLLVDPYTGGSAGTVRVVALQDVDCAVRHAESFAAITDMVTT